MAASSVLALGTVGVTGSTEQTIVDSTTRVVVVLIPGFPIESILLGLIVGIGAVLLIRRWRVVERDWRSS